LIGNTGDVLNGHQMPCHYADRGVNVVAWSSVIATQLPHAVGMAYAARLKKSKDIAVAYLGDGATSSPDFHAAMNFAGVWKAPVVFVCENNQYMEYTPIGAVTAAEHPAADRAPGYKLPARVIDGNDVVVVRDTVLEAAERARAGEGPTVIEAETYRHHGHSRTDPAKYRPAEEVERWLKHDPLDLARARLEALGVDPADIQKVDERAAAHVAAAVDAAKNAPDADAAEAFTDVWADGGATWRT